MYWVQEKKLYWARYLYWVHEKRESSPNTTFFHGLKIFSYYVDEKSCIELGFAPPNTTFFHGPNIFSYPPVKHCVTYNITCNLSRAEIMYMYNISLPEMRIWSILLNPILDGVYILIT